MNPQEKMTAHPTRGIFVFLLGTVICALPLLWPLTATDYDPHYGKYPLWVMANCGVIALASAYSLIVICCLRRWGFLWISVLGLLLIGLSLLAGFVFWAFGLLLFPIGPILLLSVGLLATFPKNKPANKPWDATGDNVPC